MTLAALALRLPALSLRPMHQDEAVHAVKFCELWQTGRYTYDPVEFHGPTLNYLTLVPMWLSGARDTGAATEATLRIVPVLAGTALIPLLWLLRDGLGNTAVVIAALLTCVSPAMMYYSRYYIQESLLVCFTLAAIACGWRFLRSERVGWAVACGVAIGLMHATKETWVIALGVIVIGLAAVRVGRVGSHVERGFGRPTIGRDRPSPAFAWVLLAAAFVITSVAFYSGFFTNWRGLADSVAALTTYVTRAGGDGVHEHPWYYYLKLLALAKLAPGPWWSEAEILVLAAVGIVAAFRPSGAIEQSGAFPRFVAAYTLALTVAYSVIPYKTPWCVLGFLHGMILLAGIGGAWLIQAATASWQRAAVCIGLAVATAQLGWQAYRASFRFASDSRNPYVYAHTSPDAVRLAALIERLSGIHPDGRRMLVRIIGPEYWPLPWYLRRLERVGYWETVPTELDAPVVVAFAPLAGEVAAGLTADYETEIRGLRPHVNLVVFVDRLLWDAYLGTATTRGAADANGGENRP